MPKSPTLWRPTDSGTATNDNSGFDYLLESGSIMLKEDSSFYLLEDSVVTTKNKTAWVAPTKVSTAWKPLDGSGTFTTSTGDTRTTISGDTRITATGDTRITELSTLVPKSPTQWTAN